jgi:hypothetical protein
MRLPKSFACRRLESDGKHNHERRPVVIHELCRCRQAGCTDPDTEARRRRFLADLARVTEPHPVPVNRIRWLLATSTATSTTSTWRYEP